MVQTVSGSCQCGGVRFEISGGFDSFFLCHCRRCQKDTGSAHAANLFSGTAAIVWQSGQDRITHYRVPDTRHARSFCSVCGAALPSVQMDGALLVVPAGSLDSEIDARPTAQICFASRAEWVDGLADVPRIDGLPG